MVGGAGERGHADTVGGQQRGGGLTGGHGNGQRVERHRQTRAGDQCARVSRNVRVDRHKRTDCIRNWGKSCI